MFIFHFMLETCSASFICCDFTNVHDHNRATGNDNFIIWMLYCCGWVSLEWIIFIESWIWYKHFIAQFYKVYNAEGLYLATKIFVDLNVFAIFIRIRVYSGSILFVWMFCIPTKSSQLSYNDMLIDWTWHALPIG